ncbi:hypothetical protein GGR50DRAFT_693623 [Xylaria sp. CBS 124048]|nr:hypothetical protein GGR50DRAFT_693623 [Xylaria sp. CBS 124048]
MTSKPDHLERTAAEPRDGSLHTVILDRVEEVNATTRVFRLGIPQGSHPIRFLPGQWLDVYIPGVEKAGGFTITSTPGEALLPYLSPSSPELDTLGPGKETDARPKRPYLELAVQKSPDNPPAAWLWRDDPLASLVGAQLRVRVGGSFVWPPAGIDVRALRRVVFVAGGVGVNPLVSMLCALKSVTNTATEFFDFDPEVHFLYSLRDPGERTDGMTRDAEKMLFMKRIASLFHRGGVRGRLRVFLTSGVAGAMGYEDRDGVIACREDGNGNGVGFHIPFLARRCTVQDVVEAAGSTLEERSQAVVYVCGVPTMTDEFVARLTGNEDGIGMESRRVLREKWW